MEEYKLWIQKAKDDLHWTSSNIENGIWYGACFTAQQVVEKALKAFLLYHKKPLKKIHDVVGLLEDTVVLDPEFEKLREMVKTVYPYYIETRYPSHEEIDRFSEEQAKEAYEHAKAIFEFVANKLLE